MLKGRIEWHEADGWMRVRPDSSILPGEYDDIVEIAVLMSDSTKTAHDRSLERELAGIQGGYLYLVPTQPAAREGGVS